MTKKQAALFIFLIFILVRCIMDGGTHGSIKTYGYPVAKAELEKAVNAIIATDTAIHRNPRKEYYNDTKTYVTITINGHNQKIDYTFRYVGDSLMWAHASSAQLFICYVYDDKGRGGSEGNGNWEKVAKEGRDSMIRLFETEFISRLDKELN